MKKEELLLEEKEELVRDEEELKKNIAKTKQPRNC